MNRRLIAALFIVASLIAPRAHAQATGVLMGTVTDASGGQPLAATHVSLLEAHRNELTHGDGAFAFAGLAPGRYTLRVERLGYATHSQPVEIAAGATQRVDVAMQVAALRMNEIVVTGTLGRREGRDVLSPTSVVSGAELERKLDGTVAATLEAEPGIAVTGIGPTTARPIIRGLGGDRILILEDGVRPGDLSATSSDHAVAVDPLTAKQFEVVRGPMSLMYGSSALGGVVNVVRDEIPTAAPEHMHGLATAQANSVNTGATAGGYVVLPAGRWGVRAEASARFSDDVRTPLGDLRNTDVRGANAAFGIGRGLGTGHTGASYRYFQNDYGIPGGYVGGHPGGVDIEMRKHTARAEIDVHGIGPIEELHTTALYSNYQHAELESSGEVGTRFGQHLGSLDIVGRHGVRGPFAEGAVGLRAQFRDVETGGDLRTPSTYDYSGAVFLIEEIGTGAVRVQSGVRFDFAHYVPRDTTAFIFVGGERIPVRERSFGNLSGSLGLLYRASEAVRLGASVARAYRTPDFNEMYSNGPHLAANSYDVGDPSIGEETGLGFDAFARFTTERIQAEVAAFRNQLNGYIFPSSRGRAELGTQGGRPRFQYTNEDARFVGAEGSVEWSVTPHVVVEAMASLVNAEFTSERDSIPIIEGLDTRFVAASKHPPLIPPANGRVGARYETPSWFAGGGIRMVAAQDRLGDFETRTPGYATGEVTAGLRIVRGDRLHAVTLAVENVTDASYRDHVSRIKEIMPEPGRDIRVTYRLSF